MTWAAETIQAIVFFPPTPDAPDALQPWIRSFGKSPQQFQSAEADAVPNSLASGIIGEFEARYIAQPGRLELVLRQAGEPTDRPPLIQDLNVAVQTCLGYVTNSLPSDVQIMRIAVTGNLVRYFETVDQAASHFVSQTNLDRIPSGALDLSFGLNMRKSILEGAVGLNRVCRWGTSTGQMIQLKIVPGSNIPSMHITSFPASNLNIDVNSAIDQIIPQDRVKEIFESCGQEFLYIANGGYTYVTNAE